MSALFTRLFLRMLPHVDGMTTYSDKLLMYDNLDTPLAQTYTQNIKDFIRLLPMKINFNVIILCIQGGVRLHCNLKDYSLTPNNFVIIPSGSKAEQLDLLDDSKVIVVVVPDKTYAPDTGFHGDTFESKNFGVPVCIEMEEAEVQQIIGVYRLLKAALQAEERNVDPELVRSYFMLLASISAPAILRRNKRGSKERLSNKEQIYQEFLLHLSEDYRQYRDVSHYAELSGLSAKYFASVIYDVAGRHPLELIKEQVIIDARRLLKQGKTIAEVCSVLNFSSQAQFTSYFKRAVGMPPGEFLKNTTL